MKFYDMSWTKSDFIMMLEMFKKTPHKPCLKLLALVLKGSITCS